MKKHNRVDQLMSEAFVIWLSMIGYRAVARMGGIWFYCQVSNKNFPRDVMVLAGGRLNKPAATLFEEFVKYDPFSGVAA